MKLKSLKTEIVINLARIIITNCTNLGQNWCIFEDMFKSERVNSKLVLVLREINRKEGSKRALKVGTHHLQGHPCFACERKRRESVRKGGKVQGWYHVFNLKVALLLETHCSKTRIDYKHSF